MTEIQPTPDTAAAQPRDVMLEFPDNRLLVDLCGPFDSHIAQIEKSLDVQIVRRGNQLVVLGEPSDKSRAADLLAAMYQRLGSGKEISATIIEQELRNGILTAGLQTQMDMFGKDARLEIKTGRKHVEPRTAAQKAYVTQLLKHEMCFGIGPAGTGKTYLAVAVGVSKFLNGEVDRIILSRPAVEAGEKLGYLPGDMKEKVDPYMQPLYDALNDFLPDRQLGKLLESKKIEIAPLAFMRGRTLSNAFVVLDEAQNTTAMQMKMFLTRLGDGARMVITGDRSQIDLPRGVTSGLVEAERILKGVDKIGFTHFTATDVVRHPLVAAIIRAYEDDSKDPSGPR